jgi:hypothetical protein
MLYFIDIWFRSWMPWRRRDTAKGRGTSEGIQNQCREVDRSAPKDEVFKLSLEEAGALAANSCSK